MNVRHRNLIILTVHGVVVVLGLCVLARLPESRWVIPLYPFAHPFAHPLLVLAGLLLLVALASIIDWLSRSKLPRHSGLIAPPDSQLRPIPLLPVGFAFCYVSIAAVLILHRFL